MIPTLRRSFPRVGGNFFALIVKWITFTRALPGQCGDHRMAQADFNIRTGKVAWRYTASAALFFVGSLLLGAVPAHGREKMPVGLSEAIAVAMRFGHLLDIPEHPRKGRAEANDDAQK
jgi:hypothetical protein